MNWRLDPRRTGLLIIDVQERLLPAMTEPEARLEKMALAVEVARQFGLPIFHTEQAPDKLGPTVSVVRDALGDGRAARRARSATFPRRPVSARMNCPRRC